MEDKFIEEKKGLSSKAKGIIAGTTAAGIAAIVGVISVVSLTGSNGGKSETYSVSISSEFEGFEDKNLTISQGTKIKDLKAMIVSPVPGYKIENFYKNAECSDGQEYNDEELVTEDAKIYIKFVIMTFTVRAYENTSSTKPIEELNDVEYMHTANLKTPTKAPDKLAKEYEFDRWVDIRNNPVDIHHITEDTDVYATFRVREYNEYTVSTLINTDAKDANPLSITRIVNGQVENLTSSNKLHYGDRVKITYTESKGYEKTNFNVVGASAADGEDAKGWYTITDNLSVTYEETKKAYIIGTLQDGVKLYYEDGNEITSESLKTKPLLYESLITVEVTATPGFHVTDVDTEGLYTAEGLTKVKYQYAVDGNISVSFSEEINTVMVKYYDYDGSQIGSETVSHGGSITKENPSRDIDDRIGTYKFTGWVNKEDNSKATLSNMQILEHDGLIEVQATYELIYQEYSFNIPTGVSVSVKRNDKVLEEIPNTLHFGDELTLSYTEREGYNYSLTINGDAVANGGSHVVTQNLTIGFSETIRTFQVEISETNVHVQRKDGSRVYSGERVNYNEEITITVYDKTGSHVTAVFLNDNKIENGSKHVVKGDINITYSEKLFTATINFYQDDRTTLIESKTGITHDSSISINDPSKSAEGDYIYTFDYWVDENDNWVNLNSISVIEDNITINIYAKYTARSIYDCLMFENYLDGYVVSNLIDQSVTDITIPATYQGLKVYGIKDNAFNNKSDIKTVTILDGVEFIGNYAFSYCYSLISINIPSSVTRIGENSFDGCRGLTSVILNEGLEIIGNNAFIYCSSLTSITIPNSVTSLGKQAFRDCRELKSATIGNGITIIEESTFSGCEKLTSIAIPNSVETIGNLAFIGCKSLTSVTIPESVKVIGNSAFMDCALTSITIPSGVEMIDGWAFYMNNNLTSVTIESANIYNAATSSSAAGYLLANVREIRVLSSIHDGSNTYIINNFPLTYTTTIDGKVYNVYYYGGGSNN